MSEKKVRFIIFLVVAVIAFICSCGIYSATGGVSDWIGNTTDENYTDEGFDLFNSSSVDSYSSNDNSDDSSSESDSEDSGFLKDLTGSSNKTQNTNTSSSVSSYSSKDKANSVSSYSSSDKYN